ncbi:MAG: DUF805 domain-containing protein [Bauldia sp.]
MEFFAAMIGFDGRINRKPYWIASIVLMVVVIALLALVTWLAVATMDIALVNVLATIVLIAVLYPSSALMVKRFHDRDRSGKLVLLLIVPTVVLGVTNLLGITGKPVPLPNPEEFDLEAGYFRLWGQTLAYQAREQPIDLAFNVWLIIIGLWFAVELGFLRGTRGPNRHGPDPLDAARTSG